MTCRVCGEIAPVYRTIKENDHIVRYRRCHKCHHEFSTLEMDEDMWGSLSKVKKLEDIVATINNAINDNVKVLHNGSTYRMAEYIAHRLFAEVKNEM